MKFSERTYAPNETSDMTTGYYYDGLEGLAKQVGADEIEGVLEYDAFGNMVCRMDDPDADTHEGLNRVTEYDFDRLGRQIAITAYDPNDSTEHVAEQTTTYEYNMGEYPRSFSQLPGGNG